MGPEGMKSKKLNETALRQVIKELNLTGAEVEFFVWKKPGEE